MKKDFPLPFETVSVVVPVYNSRTTLEELFRRLTTALYGIGKDYEILFVNDASTDDSRRVLEGFLGDRGPFADDRPRGTIRVIDLAENVGQQNATLCGIRFARGNCVLTIDDDLTYPPEALPGLLTLLGEGKYDIVYGVCPRHTGTPVRRIGSFFRDLVFEKLLNKPKDVRVTSCKAFTRNIADHLAGESTSFVYLSAVILKHTRRIGEKELVCGGNHSRTTYSLGKLIATLARLVVYYTDYPLFEKLRKYGNQYRIRAVYDEER